MSRINRSLAILDVGHGNCAVLVDTRGVAVIDTGPGSALLECLVEQGITYIDVVLLSHADKDHIGGLAQLIASRVARISRICLNCDASKGSEVWDDLVYELNKAENRSELKLETNLVRDCSGQYDQGSVRIEILAPSKYLALKGAGSADRRGRKLSSNSLSAVIRLKQDNKPIALFPGDIDAIGLDDMLDNEIDATAPLVVFPHHGGTSGSGDLDHFVRKLCEVFKPMTFVFSVARGRDKHPLPEVLLLLNKYAPNSRVACTQLSGHCAPITNQARFDHLQKVFAQGREKGNCCAGTLLIRLARPDTLNPTYAEHQGFIDAHAPTALCRRKGASNGG